MTQKGDGFVTPDQGGPDVFVPGLSLESAMDGDQVVVRVEGRPRGRSPVGRVIKVLDRAHETVVGTFRPSRSFGVVHPPIDVWVEVVIPFRPPTPEAVAESSVPETPTVTVAAVPPDDIPSADPVAEAPAE